MNKYLEYREKYCNFIYDSYKVLKENDKLKISFHYIIENLTDFNSALEINVSDIKNQNIDNNLLDYLAFHIGMVELLSYWKSTASKNIIINCGYLSDAQIKWFKKLYYNGMGEYFYVNGISPDYDTFVNIIVKGEKKEFNSNFNGKGNLITIGGGKDSFVACEILRGLKEENTCICLNPKDVHLNCIAALGYKDKAIFVYKTYIDSNLIELNKKGFLNGHTPFSAMLAFICYLASYLTERKYIVLSNEASANEATIPGTNINHQYSKSYEFENDFNNYTKEFFKTDIKYFSLLRCLTELEIAHLFSHYTKYHTIFKSCNVGSKYKPWNWCLKCSKCLFVYIILSPFLYKEKLLYIFKEDLYEDESLLSIFLELSGYSEKKPFECVGTIDEVRYALSMTIKKLKKDNIKLPFLLDYYDKNFELYENKDLLTKLNYEHNINDDFLSIVKKEVEKYAREDI